MIKGAQKRMIVVKTSDSRLFEEAYFVMRTDISTTESDMVSEANKIIEKSGNGKRDKCRRSANAVLLPLLAFMAGSIIGGGLVLAVMLICV